MKRIITFGTFDIFHVGHLNILKRAAALGHHLTVGISTDALNYSKKQRYPVCQQASRAEIVAALRCVDQVFFEEALELKREYIEQFEADVLVMGDDWAGKFDEFKDICDVVYLERTPSISTTELIEIVKEL
ncbi:adenylyltransferase/cytidyltransferase family protein [Colwellia sp. 6M3]|uniref:adenylyltransferase/cytidyltransferase family protein n=1 Tax=Colwellia sp. 6M3 TaxID=2759849 RepID=UPI0015F36D73|nr:adenylyltransferase/cytidyltransferase family protein [Colwellia sp. 6M3]MBA6417378.1 adenylyltransferase/cytidyltransferase family protein [Colwellia sp. 6M3]